MTLNNINNMKLIYKMNYIINPLTQRPIKIGGTVYNRLIRQSVIKKPDEEEKDDVILDEIPEDDEYTIEKIQDYNRMYIDDNIQCVRGRGKYKGKLVKKYIRKRGTPVKPTPKIEDDQDYEQYEMSVSSELDEELESELEESDEYVESEIESNEYYEEEDDDEEYWI